MWFEIFLDIIFPYLRRLLHRVSTIAAANFLIPDVFLLIVSEMFDTQKNSSQQIPKKSKEQKQVTARVFPFWDTVADSLERVDGLKRMCNIILLAMVVQELKHSLALQVGQDAFVNGDSAVNEGFTHFFLFFYFLLLCFLRLHSPSQSYGRNM